MLGGRSLTPLPSSLEEAKSVGDVLLLGTEANESGLLAKLASRPRWRAVHLACHGLVNSRKPAFSSLALANGDLLTTLEVFRSRIPADLVVLSACDTAKGKTYEAEGLVGFVRAFLFAGAPRVLCSLWKVDDEATLALMKEFYRFWNPKDGSKGMGTAAALKAAQEHVRTYEKEVPDPEATAREGRPVTKRVRPWEHPYYWAAWVLWGLPN
jgi:CHAT domain-containing protein